MADKTIALRELRNDVSAILRAVEQDGTTFTVTVRGKPVARLIPTGEPDGPRRFVDRETLLRMYADSPVDPDFAKDLEEADAWFDQAEDDTWPELRDLP
jgi:prevent-host-death family protein